MESIERFAESYLGQWERRATVRGSPRHALTPDAADRVFPVGLQPLCLLPAVVELGPEVRRFLLVQSCYQIMNEIAQLEVDVVSRLAGDLANRPHRIELPPAVRQVALTVAVDEAYHAFAAREFMGQVEAVTGLAPARMRTRSGLEEAASATLERTPDDLRDDMGVVILCITENLVTAEVLGMTEGSPPDNAFHAVTEEHLIDERRHAGYFQRLLAHYWRALPDPVRDALAVLVPEFLERFVDSHDFVAEGRALLAAAGVEPAVVDAVAAEVAAFPFRRGDHPMARNMVGLLERVGVLADPSVRATLVRGGWIAAA